MHLHFYKSFLFSNSIVDFPVYHIYVYALFYLPGSDKITLPFWEPGCKSETATILAKPLYLIYWLIAY